MVGYRARVEYMFFAKDFDEGNKRLEKFNQDSEQLTGYSLVNRHRTVKIGNPLHWAKEDVKTALLSLAQALMYDLKELDAVIDELKEALPYELDILFEDIKAEIDIEEMKYERMQSQ